MHVLVLIALATLGVSQAQFVELDMYSDTATCAATIVGSSFYSLGECTYYKSGAVSGASKYTLSGSTLTLTSYSDTTCTTSTATTTYTSTTCTQGQKYAGTVTGTFDYIALYSDSACATLVTSKSYIKLNTCLPDTKNAGTITQSGSSLTVTNYNSPSSCSGSVNSTNTYPLRTCILFPVTGSTFYVIANTAGRTFAPSGMLTAVLAVLSLAVATFTARR